MSGGEPRGELELDRLIASLEPRLDPEPYAFRVERDPAGAAPPESAIAAVREEEGWTWVVQAATPGAGSWARIVLTVHSDLEAVGLLAAVAGRLAAAAIPVNAMAGWYHDHLFVPWERREAALSALGDLQREAAARRRG